MKVYVLLMVVAAALTVLLTPLVRWACLKWGIVPKLRSRDIQAAPIPRLGGIAITIALVITMLISARIPYMAPLFETNAAWAVVGGACAMCALGVVDDVVELDWMTKLSGQILIAGSMAFNGVQMVSFPIFGLTIGSSRLSLMLTVLLIVGIMNAVNFIDGLDGLAAGIVGIGAAAFFVYSYVLTRIMGAASYATTASLAVITLVGVCLGFLWFNYHPSSLMMGGGILVPIGDLVVTSVRRMLRGKSPFHADRSHFHDRLLERGHSHRGVVAILWMWTALVAFPPVALLTYDWRVVALCTLPALFIGMRFTASEFPTYSLLFGRGPRRRRERRKTQ